MPSAAQLAETKKGISDLGDTPAAYRDAVAACFRLGILNGTAPGVFSGAQSMKRSAAATVYVRVKAQIAKLQEAPVQPEPEPETPAAALANGQPITDGNIRALIEGLKTSYPEGMRWTNDNFYMSEAANRGGFGCEGFALLCSDAAFGSLPITGYFEMDFARIRVGDLLRVNYDTHTVIVLEKRADSVVVAEGNYNSSIHWGRVISRQSLEDGDFYVRTRYPVE